MKKFIRENGILLMGIGLPIALALTFVLAATIPKYIVAPPKHDLVFSFREYHHNLGYRAKATIDEEKLSVSCKKDQKNNYQRKVYRFRVREGVVEEIPISFKICDKAELWTTVPVQKFSNVQISSNHVSPDGYGFVPAKYRGRGLLAEIAGGSRYSKAVISKDGRIERIPKSLRNNYYYNFEFLGWIISEEGS